VTHALHRKGNEGEALFPHRLRAGSNDGGIWRWEVGGGCQKRESWGGGRAG
jgi:hypothetical protein